MVGLLLLGSLTVALAGWPPLDKPPRVGGGAQDAALVVGVEDYAFVPGIPGARQNARDWHTWFTDGLRTPAHRVQLLLDEEATSEEIAAQATRLAGEVGADGTLWIVFIGHGAPTPDGADALLLGADVQARANSMISRGLSREALLAATDVASRRVLVLDSCFSGRTPAGEPIARGLQPLVPAWAARQSPAIELSAGRMDQLAGALPGDDRPAFTYLLLGALHGWGDADRDGVVTASEAVAWTRKALDTVLVDRRQEPQHSGPDGPLAAAGRSRAPDLAERVVRRAHSPRPTPAAPDLPPVQIPPGDGLGLDVEVEEKYWAAVKVGNDPFSTPAHNRNAWCALASLRRGDHVYGAPATAACDQWRAFTSHLDETWSDFRRDYDAARSLLAMKDSGPEVKLAVLDQLQVRYAEVHSWYGRRITHARHQVAAGRSARLPSVKRPPDWTARGAGGSGFLWSWDRTNLRYPIVPLHAGGGLDTTGAVAFSSSPSFIAATWGPLDAGLFNITGRPGEPIHVGGHVGFVPFVVRPSDRTPGEPRGSYINPAIGLGGRVGGDLTDGQIAWVEPYVANTLWFSNLFGVRLEYRQPIANTPVPGSFFILPTVNPMSGYHAR